MSTTVLARVAKSAKRPSLHHQQSGKVISMFVVAEDAYRQQCIVDGEIAHLDILDTAGQREFTGTAMREQYMRSGEGFLLCYSITDRRSYQEIQEYKRLINRVRCQENIPLVLVANKTDLESQRQVTETETRL